MSSSDLESQQATIFDLQRRIAILEQMIHGHEQASLPEDFLTGSYLDAQKHITPSEEVCRHWTRQIFMLDVRQLLTLVRLSQDIHPWKPYLIVLDRLCADGYDAEGARVHLLSIARQLLVVQGLELLEPRDMMGIPPPMQIAIHAISK